MATSPDLLDFSILKDARDPLEIFAAEQQLLSVACPDLTKRTLDDPTIAKSLITSGVAGFLHLRADGEARQMQLETVRRPATARCILRALGTDLRPPTAATVDVTMRVAGSIPADLAIPQYTVLEASGSHVQFVVTDEYARFRAGASPSAIVRVMQGEFVEEQLSAQSDGAAGQYVDTVASDLLHSEAQQTVRLYGTPPGAPEEEWIFVASFAGSGPFDKHFRLERLANGRSRVLWGDGKSGAVPVFGTTWRLAGISGGGVAGNVGAGEIDRLLTPLFDIFGASLAVSVSNSLAAEGGSDEQSVDQARTTAPLWWRAQDRAVTAADYAALARMVPGVLDAQARRVATGSSLTLVALDIIGDSASGGASPTVLSAVEEYVSARKSATDDLVVGVASFVPVDVTATVRVIRGRSSAPETIRQNVEHLLGAASAELLADARRGNTRAVAELRRYFFDLRARAVLGQKLFGDTDSLDGHAFTSDLTYVFETTPGVANSDLVRFARVPVPTYPVQRGDTVLSGIVISSSTLAEEITVRWRGASGFRVSGSLSGHLGFGELGATFTDELARVSFLASGSAAIFGDVAKFKVSQVVGNVRCPHEVFVAGTVSISAL